MYQYEEVWIKENHPDFLSVYKRPMPVESGADINSVRLFPLGDISSNVWVIESTTADAEVLREEIATNAVPDRLVELGAMTKTFIQNRRATDTTE
jgi:hypothetical protein